jgi:hypothetical protein
LIYNIFQNADRSYNSGLELVFSEDVSKQFSFNVNLNGYRNQINAFTVVNEYPVLNTFSAPTKEIYSWSGKVNGIFHLPKSLDVQVTTIYLAPDLIPQGKIEARFSLDVGLKKSVQNGRGEYFINASDLLNTMIIKKEIQGQGFKFVSEDYYETQVVRIGYNYKF